MQSLHHFYHLFADGDFEVPVREHWAAIRYDGLAEALASTRIGFVGTEENVERARVLLAELDVEYTTAAEAREGWEQVTLNPLYAFCQDNDGFVAYAHTKGAANFDPINWYWRRSMEFYNFAGWRQPVSHLEAGTKTTGCHWLTAAQSATPGWGSSGMFGGNYWWARCDAVRLGPPPELENRFQAEHWLGRLAEVTDMSGRNLVDLHPGHIVVDSLKWDWLQGEPPQ